MTNTLMSQVKDLAKDNRLTDQTEDTGGTFERVTAPAGRAAARFVSYVELGLRPGGEYKGEAKPAAREARLVFELSGKKHEREVGEGENKRTIRNTIGFKIAIKSGERANFTKLMKKMIAGRDGITHMAQMLGEGFLVDVKHRESEKDGKKVVYANLKDSEGYHIGAPAVSAVEEDGITMTTKVLSVPEPLADLQLLLWDNPSQEQWDSLYIDGTRTQKVNGQEVEVSKNWLQELCMEALDFAESPLAMLVNGGELNLDGGQSEAEDDLDSAPVTPPSSDPLNDLELDDEIPF